MFVFQKIWRALLLCYLRFEIRYFALLPKNLCFAYEQVMFQNKSAQNLQRSLLAKINLSE